MGTMNKVIQSGWLSEEEWDVEACIVAEDDGAYFVEDLTKSEALSNNIAAKEYEEEEWDAEASFSMEVRDPNTYTWFIVFEYDDGEDWETPSYEEYGADTEGALTIHEDLKTRDEVKEASRRI